VDDRWVLCVQIRERVGGVGQVGEHTRRSESGVAAAAQQARKIGPVHPVHGDDVLVVVEEVLPHKRKRGVRREAEQDPCLSQQVLPIGRAAHQEDLERDEPVVLMVESPDDAPLAARSQLLQELVAFAQKLSHRTPTAVRRALVHYAP
jgi:hypothetical protein